MGDSTPPASFSRRVRLGWYGAVAALALLLPLVGYRFDIISLDAPLLYDEDALLIFPMVKATIERGSHWRTEQLGAPGIQEMHDFPVIDHLHFAGIWLLGRVVPDVVVVFNVYYLLGYPLAALTAMAVLRHFGLSFFAAAVGGILFAMQPYHFYRGQSHYFLSAYFFVPVTSMVILWVMRGRLPGFPRTAEGTRPFRVRDRDTVVAILIAAVTSAAGAYYAFFAAGLLVCAGLYGWVALKTWRAAASAMFLVGVIFVGGLVNHAPTFWYQAQYGKHTAPTERYSEESELYGLKLTQLLLPIDDHRVKLFMEAKTSYSSYDRPVQASSERYSLGLVAACGVLLLLVRVVLPVRRESPYTELAAIALCAFVIATVGGFGAIFNHLISPQVRCYNRIAIYVAFFALYAILHALDELFRRVPKVVAGFLWILLAVGGVLDQTPFHWGSPVLAKTITDQQDRFRTDRVFFHEIEETLREDGASPMVFQLPYVRWPESPPTRNLSAYDHARGYVHTKTLRWNYGCMKGREVDEWYRHVSILPVEQLLEHIVAAGFDGLMLDKRGYAPAKANQLEQQIGQVLGEVTKVMHPHKDQVFFDLRKHRSWLRNHYGPGWDALCERELNRVRILWLDGFTSYKELGYEWQHRWCKPKGLAVFVNPTNEMKSFETQFIVRTMTPIPGRLHIRGGDLWTQEIDIDPNTPVQVRTFNVPPGRHKVHFSFDVPDSYVPRDSRWLVFYFSGLRLE